MRRHAKAIVAISALLLLTLALGVTFATATAPVVSIDAPSAVTYTSAHVSGQVNPEDHDTYYSFETSTDGGASWSGFGFLGPVSAGSGSQDVATDLTGLKPGTAYLVRLVANNFSDPEVVSAEQSFSTDPVGAPVVSLDPVTTFAGTTAHFSGTIDPQAPEAAPATPAVEAGFKVDWHFECTPECPGLNGTIPADNSAHQVQADATGLLPGTKYKVSLVAANAAGAASAGPRSFITNAVAPTITGTGATSLSTEATLEAQINPGGATTAYYFDYGSGTAYGQRTTTRSLVAGTDPITVKVPIYGLLPQSTYHFRVVVTNAVDTTTSADQSFMTSNQNSADSCPNAEIRALQGISNLPGCRAFEQVSAVNKEGGAVRADRTVQSSLNGEAVAYASDGAFAGAQMAMEGSTYYIARRAAQGWFTEAIDAPQHNNGQYLARPSFFLSSDLGSTVQYSPLALAPGAIEEGGNLYMRDNLTGSRRLLAATPERGIAEFLAEAGRGNSGFASSDLSHYVVASEAHFVPGIEGSLSNLYEMSNGEVRLVNRLPNGEPTPHGSTTGAISSNGRRIFFTDSQFPIGPLYMREDGRTTVPISESRRTGEEGVIDEAKFLGASKDGSVVFFYCGSFLTNENNGGIYRLDLDTQELALVVPEFDPNLAAAFKVSADGSGIFFGSALPLTPEGEFFGSNFYVWRNGTLTPIGTSRGNFVENFDANTSLSPNGRYFALQSSGSLTGHENGGLPSIFVWDTMTGSLSCASCDDSDGPAAATLNSRPRTISNYEPRTVLDDGSVFFSTPAALSPEDTNGHSDVYRWKDGVTTLISSGKGSSGAQFQDASPDGRDVYFTTSTRLVADDIDQDVDLYDARADGGIPSQNTAPSPAACSGEGCQGALIAPPTSGAPASGAATGPYNVKSRKHSKAEKRCKVGQRKTPKGRCVARKRTKKPPVSNSRGSK